MRLIDADELRAVKFHALPYTHIHPSGAEPYSYELGWNDAIDAIMDCAPTVDTVKHGHWIKDRLVSTSGGTYGVYRCSKCEWYGQDIGYSFNYCPHCGAKMDEVAK